MLVLCDHIRERLRQPDFVLDNQYAHGYPFGYAGIAPLFR
jgi:hypothetical protein